MPRSGLTGSRIRERREVIGMRQAELARQSGISASYLNLIEHNRRRIGGKLLLDIAGVLGVEPAQLSEGAEAALTATLREAAAERQLDSSETDRVEELAGRFPGWARLLADQHARIGQLEQSVEALTDRLAHDPHLAASLHEVLSTVTAIHSASSILVETRELEREWRDRFHRNIHEDSARLAEGAQRLVDELDAGTRQDATGHSPQDEVQAFLDTSGWHFPELEAGQGAAKVLGRAEMGTGVAQDLLRDRLEGLADDAARLPLDDLLTALKAERALEDTPPEGPDPTDLAQRLGVGADLVMRRLVALPADLRADLLPAAPGIVVADASGTLLERREAEGFPLPRYGAACPLWPLFQALHRPMLPLRQVIEMAGRAEGTFVTYALAVPRQTPRPDEPPNFRTHMLIWPATRPAGRVPRVGVTCRICPRENCTARREPSIMAERR